MPLSLPAGQLLVDVGISPGSQHPGELRFGSDEIGTVVAPESLNVTISRGESRKGHEEGVGRQVRDVFQVYGLGGHTNEDGHVSLENRPGPGTIWSNINGTGVIHAVVQERPRLPHSTSRQVAHHLLAQRLKIASSA